MEGGDYHEEKSISPAGPYLGSSWAKELSSARFGWTASERCFLAATNWVPHVMRCKNPYVTTNLQAYGCGQCLPCRINKRREWTHRILLESIQYTDNTFATLTYRADENGDQPSTLVPEHARNFLKRIRKSIEPRKLRYYIVGEYGDDTERPHYHVALFNYPTCRLGNTQYNRSGIKCCATCELVSQIWGHGNIYLGLLEPHSAAYIAGYVTKKMTRTDDVRLGNRHPEFARMSLRPGIGHGAMWDMASALISLSQDGPDVPTALRHGKKIMPLGRYLTRSLRAMTGNDQAAPLEAIQKSQEKLLDLQIAAIEATSGKNMAQFRRMVYKNLIIDRYKGKVAQIENKQAIYKQRKSL